MSAMTAWLGPAFAAPCTGSVHSVFSGVVNLRMETGCECRLLTLLAPGLPRVPDAVRAPETALLGMRIGMPARLENGALRVGEWACAIRRDEEWNGQIPAMGAPMRKADFLRLTEALSTGLQRVPGERGLQARAALRTADAPRWIGLGPGLTPAYDDALVGAMALCRVTGRPAPFHITGHEDTTDVSLRYLKLAAEGRFGEPICRTAAALCGEGSLEESVAALRGVGATSGSDTLYGMRCMLLSLFEGV